MGNFEAYTGKNFAQYGVIVGRNDDNQLSCIDNLFIRARNNTSDSWSVMFSDDFNRPDSPDLGSVSVLIQVFKSTNIEKKKF